MVLVYTIMKFWLYVAKRKMKSLKDRLLYSIRIMFLKSGLARCKEGRTRKLDSFFRPDTAVSKVSVQSLKWTSHSSTSHWLPVPAAWSQVREGGVSESTPSGGTLYPLFYTVISPTGLSFTLQDSSPSCTRSLKDKQDCS